MVIPEKDLANSKCLINGSSVIIGDYIRDYRVTSNIRG